MTLEAGIPKWDSDEARKKESHVARFLEREYKSLTDRPVDIGEVDLCPAMGVLSEQTNELMDTHYDERFEFFDSFLDRHYRAYTMAYYGETAEDVKISDITLEEAQRNKFKLICDRIGIKGNERILNIGCGFGSFEQYLFEEYPEVEVVGVTPSHVQVNYLEQCIRDDNHLFSEKKFHILRKDLESMGDQDVDPESFDVVTSIGLVCAIRNLGQLHEKVARYLKKGGKAFHHLIVSRPVIPQFLDPQKSLIGDYFPGGRIWPFDELPKHANDLELVKCWFINGMNYWATLDEWHRRFWENMDKLKEHLPEERLVFWNDYFILCKACFLPGNGTYFGNGHYLFKKD